MLSEANTSQRGRVGDAVCNVYNRVLLQPSIQRSHVSRLRAVLNARRNLDDGYDTGTYTYISRAVFFWRTRLISATTVYSARGLTLFFVCVAYRSDPIPPLYRGTIEVLNPNIESGGGPFARGRAKPSAMGVWRTPKDDEYANPEGLVGRKVRVYFDGDCTYFEAQVHPYL